MTQRKLLFVGKSGAGKGTQAKLLEKFGFEHISTGDCIRRARKRQDPMIMPYRETLDNGELLPDDALVSLLNEALKDAGDSSYILDGAIRNLAQAELALQRGLYDEIFHFYLGNEIANRRMCRRRTTEERPEDATPESRTRKLEIYRTDIRPILDYSRERGIPVHEINADPSIAKDEKQRSVELVNIDILKTLILS